MAINTIGIFLMKGTTSSGSTTYNKLVDIKNKPALIGSPEALETTTLSDAMRHYIPGLAGNDTKEFTCNYDKAKFLELQALEGTEQDLAVWFGGTKENGVITPTGSDGKFSFKGYVAVRDSESEVNAVQEMVVSVFASSDVTVA